MQKIEAKDIREGDLIRIEYPAGGGFSTRAVEYEAITNSARYSLTEGQHYLLNRPVKVPTKLYAVVAPPNPDEGYPYVLDTASGWDRNKRVWREGTGDAEMESEVVGSEVVATKLQEGWRVVFEGIDDPTE